MISGSDPYATPTNDPWWSPGWTSQNPVYTFAATTPPPSSFPADIPKVTITETYVDEDGAIEGSILVRPNARFHDQTSGVEVTPKIKRYPIVGGVVTFDLPVMAGISYTVREAFPGGEQYAITIPDGSTGTLELLDLVDANAPVVPIESVPEMYGWQYPATS